MLKNCTYVELAFALTFILLLGACQEEEILEETSQEEINAAQQYFECEIDTEGSNNAQRTHGKGLLRKDLLESLDWGKAFVKATTFGEAIYIPVQYDHDYYTAKGSTSIRLDQMSYVMMYKANGNSYKLEVVITLPDEEFLSNDKWFDEFIGEVIVEDWKGNFIRGYRYTDEGIMSTQLVDNTNNNSSQRLPEYYECVTISHYDCTAAYWEDDEGNLHYTSMNCELSHVTSECTEGSGYSNTYNWSTYELPSNLTPGPAPADPDKDDKDNPPLELCAEDYVRVLVDGEYKCVPEPPCKGDPVNNPEIASQTISGVLGGMYGCNRYGGLCNGPGDRNRNHGGIDIVNPYGSPVYSMYDGFIYNALYDEDGAGYFTQIQCNINGQTVIFKYFHMQSQGRITSGHVSAGQIIGYQGDSGNLKNAIEDGSTISHVHIEARLHDGSNGWNYYNNFNPVDPRNYLSTQINNSGETIEESNCN